MKDKKSLIDYYNKTAEKRDKWKKRNRFYHKTIERYYSKAVPKNSSILELGCGTGDLLASLKPKKGLGVDISGNMLERAREKYPNIDFLLGDAENVKIEGKYDFIIISDLLSGLWDVQQLFSNLKNWVHPETRILINNYNYFWEPILRFGEIFRIKQKQYLQNWLSVNDIKNLLILEGFELIKVESKLLLPKYIPILNLLFNKFLSNLPLLNSLNLIKFLVAKPIETVKQEYSVSILVPARNEKGNIENAILRTPKFGKWQEFIFVEGNSNDGTYDEILRIKQKYSDMRIQTLKQSGKGKGNAVREGFEVANGDVLMILDADLTTPPEDMPKFYRAISESKGEFINGCRLVYPMEKQAMRFLNFLGNKFFSWLFSYLLGQKLKDTLCGTKVLLKSDYEKIKANQKYFGDFDPFGDFDLLFGAAKLNLKITEIIVRYKDREYGSTQISRFKHGWLLLKMSAFAARKLKFN